MCCAASSAATRTPASRSASNTNSALGTAHSAVIVLNSRVATSNPARCNAGEHSAALSYEKYVGPSGSFTFRSACAWIASATIFTPGTLLRPRPQCEGVTPTRSQHACGFGKSQLGRGQVQHAEVHRHGIERLVPVLQCLSIALVKLEFRIGACRDRHHGRGKIDPNGHCPTSTSCFRHIAGPASDVEQPCTGPQPAAHRAAAGRRAWLTRSTPRDSATPRAPIRRTRIG